MRTTVGMNYKNQLQELCQKRRLSIPKYELVDTSGQSHCPVVVVRVTVNWDGEELVEEARGEGLKRKDVEKKAAEQMYQRILETKLSSVRPAPTVSASVTTPHYSSTAPLARSPLASVKNQLQELLQKSVYNLPPPSYEDVTSHRKGEFTSKITIVNHGGKVLAQEYGYGKTKKESEANAARIMVPIMQKKLESGNLSAFHHVGSPPTPPRTGQDPEPPDSGLIDGLLSEFTPRFDFQSGTDGVVLCLARSQVSCEAAAHGMGGDKQAALMDAKLNLHHCLQYLGFVK